MRRSTVCKKRGRSQFASVAFTTLELLAVMVIIAILALLTLPALDKFRGHAEGVRCMGNMRSLHTSFASYITDRGHWPQVPEEIKGDQNLANAWWIEELKSFGAPREVWQCPSFMRLARMGMLAEEDIPPLHYMPTEFDDNAFTPHRWSKQPWLIEVGDFHGDGNFLIYPDGSITTMNRIFESGGSR